MSNAPRMRRITYKYIGDQLTLTDSRVVDGIAPPSQPIPERAHGTWIEVHDADDTVLYTRIGCHALEGIIELHFPLGSPVSHALAYADTGQGIGQLLIPDDPTATAIVFFGVFRDGPQSTHVTAAEMARLKLT